MKTKRAEVSIYLDNKRPKKNGKCSVKLRVYYNRSRRYYATGQDLNEKEFNHIFVTAHRKTQEQKEVLKNVNYQKVKAETVIDELNVFSFNSFEEKFFSERNVDDKISFAFEKKISLLNEENRISTASTYDCANKSLKKFNSKLTFADITPSLLSKYEAWMIKDNKSKTTVGIYLRNLRAIYNEQDIDKALYPFGRKEGEKKYKIPSSKNTKKALTISEISMIYNYKPQSNSKKEMAKDYWLFLYLCNGMNVKDFCLLKWENIDNNVITYKRAKTERSTAEQKTIKVALKPESLEIIRKWGQPSIDKTAFIFPHLTNKMNAKKQRDTHKQLTKTMNKYTTQIATELGINKPITSYYARHSFATVLKRSGTGIEMISELLGHSNTIVTQNYLDSFENYEIQKQTDALTRGFEKFI